MYENLKIEISRIMDNPFQPRVELNRESIEELAKSIELVGLLQPIVVNINKKNEVTLISGQRRLEAFKLLKREIIPCAVISGDPEDNDLRVISLVENLQREEMTSYDTAVALKELNKNGLTLEKIAKLMSKSVAWISKMISVTSAPEGVKNLVTSGELDISKASIISSIKDIDDSEKELLAQEVVDSNMTKKDLEETTKEKRLKVSGANEWLHFENKLSEFIKSNVLIKSKKIEISFTDEDNLVEIIKKIAPHLFEDESTDD